MKHRPWITAASTIQIILWAPYLLDPCWTIPRPWILGGRWIKFFPPLFCLGTATDFIPALFMVTAGLIALFAAPHPAKPKRLSWVLSANVAAVVALTTMHLIGAIAGVIGSHDIGVWTLITLLVWLVPPLTLIGLTRKNQEAQNTKVDPSQKARIQAF